VVGEVFNIKITTAPDLELAEAWLARREARA
jgi:2-C-methyl-D-erythritol 4-phosphate cytidylyltransferase